MNLDILLKGAILLVAGAIGWNACNVIVAKPLRNEFATFKFAVNSRGKQQEVRVETVEREIVVVQEVGRKEDAARIEDLGIRLRIARDELRISRRSQLKDSDAAPAECRDYAADPRQLSLPNADFLVGEAARAERIVVQRDACIRDYGNAKAKLDELAKETRK